ncbi:hypothetical protein B0T24DRAFT_592207 [Lasiosphaeria ovina]|uniref:Uncharacterized protein n=1 Tax=Lasiosphaeria ovina TaxID=92902 RepID=A0AAE0NA84_9PEZI|nr:hypothetical protein B0T24DRAFT_592207 [Lasiosphaeria ovina]
MCSTVSTLFGPPAAVCEQRRLLQALFMATQPRVALFPTPHSPTKPSASKRRLDSAAEDILNILRQARASEAHEQLAKQLDAAAGTAGGWTAALAERLVPAVEYALAYYRQGAGWDAVFVAAYHCSIAAVVQEFEHLVAHAEKYLLDIAVSAAVLELTALGILACLLPNVVRLLGFGGLGPPNSSSFAASWMAQHPGHVHRRAFVSFLKRLDMDWSQV